MKVYYISNKYDGCWYVRCLLPMVANGWDGDKTSLFSPRVSSDQMLQGALHADVVVFQRPDDEAKLQALPLLQQAGKKVVFDNDDTYLPDSGVPTIMTSVYGKEKLKELNNHLHNFVRGADLVTCTTEFLAEEYRALNKNVVVLPNCIDPDDWDEEPLRNEGDKIRIGLVGSVLANNDYASATELLHYLNKREDVQLVIYGLPPKKPETTRTVEAYSKEFAFWEQFNIEWIPVKPTGYYQPTLNSLKLDIMLIPREESYFNKCKSNLKYLEASIYEIPVVATSFSDKNSPYDKDIVDWENGCLINPGQDWIPVVEKLIADKELRRKIGRNAKQYVLKNYNIHDKAHLWEDAYKNL